ncbi:hypothetical protein R2601_04453 [Salipiger bermudensis HTCC2601]|uniref:Uncharacterized protein n=1 Tax=Salipiger bermudensis (strain DSM 26914 / JCM 13377 / KCTC 12554 / HTCC2601) TaxID=314265 RepID=Q0FVV5_SALBH|nr:hypothetical protein R2601_04453 [Salipiger bermudensis HTCC2601]
MIVVVADRVIARATVDALARDVPQAVIAVAAEDRVVSLGVVDGVVAGTHVDAVIACITRAVVGVVVAVAAF